MSLPRVRILTLLLLLGCGVARPQAEVRERPKEEPPRLDAAPSVEAGRAPGGLAAIVGPDVITTPELERRVRQRRAQLSEMYPSSLLEAELARLSYLTCERMIDTKLVLQLVKKEEEKNEGRPYASDIDVDRAVERQVAATKEKNPLVRSADDLYRVIRETQGLSRDEYRKYLKDQIAYETYLRANVLKAVDSFVSPETRRVYYRSHIDEYTTPQEIAFRTILIRLGREDAWARRQAVEKGIEEGADFAELAKKYSEEAVAGDVEAAGRLWRKSYEELKSWMPPIPETLRRLKAGRTSEGIPTARGLQYFHVEEVVEGKPKTFSEVQEEIGKKIREEREEAEVEEFTRRLRARTYIRNLLPKPPEAGKPKEKEAGAASKGEKKGEEKKSSPPADRGGGAKDEEERVPPAHAAGEKKEGS